jgi:hypothetical protein
MISHHSFTSMYHFPVHFPLNLIDPLNLDRAVWGATFGDYPDKDDNGHG